MQRTPLYNFHVRSGAKMVEFAGWEMPIHYASIVEEHHQTRNAASLFDVSHMGRIELHGADAEALLQRVCTRQLSDTRVGQSRYSHICNETGDILDDVIVSRYDDHWLVVCNASNREKILAWLRRHGVGRDIQIKDTTESTLMIAFQGPAVLPKLSEKMPFPIDELKRYHFQTGTRMTVPYTVFRSGYTGEDGVEIIVPATIAFLVEQFLGGLIEDAEGPRPAGLGARDTLRLEAGMPLYDHELHENVDPISAGQAWCVDLEKDFIGVEALRKISETGPEQRLVGLQLDGRRIARPEVVVMHGDEPVGKVTSGTFSPTLKRSIAMAYVRTDVAEAGQVLGIDFRGKRTEATIVKLPFYKRAST